MIGGHPHAWWKHPSTDGAGRVQVDGHSPLIEWTADRDPGTIRVSAASPITLWFLRLDAAPATAVVIFAGLGIVATLPPYKPTCVELGCRPPGLYEFCSPDGRPHGNLLVVG